MVQSDPNLVNRSMEPGAEEPSVTASPANAAGETAICLQDYFSRLAAGFGLPRTLGPLFATLFLAAGPMSFDEIVRAAGVSKASASMGLRQLRQLRTVETVLVPGDRRTFFRAETSVRRLVSGLISGTLINQLESGDRLLRAAAGALTASTPPHWADRVASLQRWHESFRDLLPALNRFGTG